MSPSFAPLKLLLLMFAGWVNRHQLDVIEYLQEGNRVLKERLGRRRLTQYFLFFIDIASRSVHIAGITPHPDNAWMTQIARNITPIWTTPSYAASAV
jgi:hypothetical protein